MPDFDITQLSPDKQAKRLEEDSANNPGDRAAEFLSFLSFVLCVNRPSQTLSMTIFNDFHYAVRM